MGYEGKVEHTSANFGNFCRFKGVSDSRRFGSNRPVWSYVGQKTLGRRGALGGYRQYFFSKKLAAIY